MDMGYSREATRMRLLGRQPSPLPSNPIHLLPNVHVHMECNYLVSNLVIEKHEWVSQNLCDECIDRDANPASQSYSPYGYEENPTVATLEAQQEQLRMEGYFTDTLNRDRNLILDPNTPRQDVRSARRRSSSQTPHRPPISASPFSGSSAATSPGRPNPPTPHRPDRDGSKINRRTPSPSRPKNVPLLPLNTHLPSDPSSKLNSNSNLNPNLNPNCATLTHALSLGKGPDADLSDDANNDAVFPPNTHVPVRDDVSTHRTLFVRRNNGTGVLLEACTPPASHGKGRRTGYVIEKNAEYV
eukprot:CAMPEP_0175040042 /NCGR_PEP_ID=MMETSP0052_2-20121109/1007_1 /TAXON_ID=51329 ORGANISM="Polytomella parva, Strain SAG 63-3" /NCGR_SAMPLE_ID=MMETSP0052_2 /ASSEMBLY_ACC=CAM_ASM_000194 /LENGTH=298 /DNA_ID=CAMNT_0016302137 /DNA_START=31 /DNA_END=924 /DNA_ORIENTATION=-